MVLSGAVPALAAIVIGALIARRSRLRLRVSLRRREPLVAIVGR